MLWERKHWPMWPCPPRTGSSLSKEGARQTQEVVSGSVVSSTQETGEEESTSGGGNWATSPEMLIPPWLRTVAPRGQWHLRGTRHPRRWTNMAKVWRKEATV